MNDYQISTLIVNVNVGIVGCSLGILALAAEQ